MRSHPFSLVFAAAVLLPLVWQAASAGSSTVPVILQPDTDHGACSIGLKVNAGGAELRSGPGTNYPVIAKLKAGHVVAGCAEADGWDGVIDGTDERCGVGLIVNKAHAYSGPCNSGWINQKQLTSIYG